MKYVIATLIAGVLFGSTGTAQALGTDGSNPISVGAARIVFGGGLLAIISWVLSRRAPHTGLGTLEAIPDPMPGTLRSTHRLPSWVVVAFGGIAVVAYQPLFFGGARLNGVAIGTVVALGSAPIFTGVFEGVLNRQFPGRNWAVSTGGAIIGVALLALASAETTGGAGPLGLVVSAGAGLAYATYSVLIKVLLGRGWSSSSAVGALFGAGAIGSLPLLVLSQPNWLGTGGGIAMLIWLALVTTVCANLFFGFGLVGLKAATVSTLTLAEPLTASLLGLAVLHETLDGLSILGLTILGAAIAYLAIASGRNRSRPAG